MCKDTWAAIRAAVVSALEAGTKTGSALGQGMQRRNGRCIGKWGSPFTVEILIEGREVSGSINGKPQELGQILAEMPSRPMTQDQAWEWVQTNLTGPSAFDYAAYAARLGMK